MKRTETPRPSICALICSLLWTCLLLYCIVPFRTDTVIDDYSAKCTRISRDLFSLLRLFLLGHIIDLRHARLDSLRLSAIRSKLFHPFLDAELTKLLTTWHAWQAGRRTHLKYKRFVGMHLPQLTPRLVVLARSLLAWDRVERDYDVVSCTCKLHAKSWFLIDVSKTTGCATVAFLV